MNIAARFSQGMREATVKAELIEYLRGAGKIPARASIALELVVGGQANRVDLSLISEKIHHFEIKTSFDTLNRLDQQVQSYLKSGQYVTVVASEKHLNAVISRIPVEVGVLEVPDFRANQTVREIRAPKISPFTTKESLLEILPVSEIQNRILKTSGRLKRADVQAGMDAITKERAQEGLISFLHSRYGLSTRDFLRKTRNRRVHEKDLDLLRLWGLKARSEESSENAFLTNEEAEQRVYQQIGRSFGPVPEEIRRDLKS